MNMLITIISIIISGLLSNYYSKKWAIKTSPGKNLLDSLSKEIYDLFNFIDFHIDYIYHNQKLSYVFEKFIEKYRNDKIENIRLNIEYLNKDYRDFFKKVESLIMDTYSDNRNIEIEKKFIDGLYLFEYFLGINYWDPKQSPKFIYFLNEMNKNINDNIIQNYLDFILGKNKFKEQGESYSQFNGNSDIKLYMEFICHYKEDFIKTIKILENDNHQWEGREKIWNYNNVINSLETYIIHKQKKDKMESKLKMDIIKRIQEIKNNSIFKKMIKS